jgi:hypothetical protein
LKSTLLQDSSQKSLSTYFLCKALVLFSFFEKRNKKSRLTETGRQISWGRTFLLRELFFWDVSVEQDSFCQAEN